MARGDGVGAGMAEELEPISKRIPNRKWRLFIDELFKQNQNGTKAYQTVYGCSYDTARANAPTLLANTSISEEIERRLKESAMSADEALMRLAEHARADIGEYADIDSNAELADHPLSRIVKKFKKNVWYDKKGNRHESIELELYDAQSAIRDILKIHGKFDGPGSSEDKPFYVTPLKEIVVNRESMDD